MKGFDGEIGAGSTFTTNANDLEADEVSMRS